jgi:uncharacterized GH25 family protein
MNRKKILALTLLLSLVAFVQAHEYWIMPTRFFLKPGEQVSLTAMVGENYEGEKWGGGNRKLTSFKHYTSSGIVDELKSIQQDTSKVNIEPLMLVEEGTHLLTFTTNSQFLTLEPLKFNEYLRDDGLEDVIASREKNGESMMKSRELYRRCAKVLLQVGKKTDATFKTSVDLALDIKPLKNPYEYKSIDKPTFQISYDGKAYTNALVRCWHRANNKTDMQVQRTNKSGEVTFNLAGEGNYMISVVKMDRLKETPQADWQSTWGSLVFGVKF